ncbi:MULTISPECIES: DUF3662 domain-containing protein [unclassified Streptomyces]|uniref:DUF3662 domain-containing protein n=1 Tax=unclassified Streptomyces TaxID=2593676 RepID=UPI00382507CA
MGMLRRWERAIERWEQALYAKVFDHEPVELLDALRRECDGHAVVCSASRVVVPNVYTVELAAPVHEELGSDRERVGEALTDALQRHAERRDYEWAGPLAVHITRAARLPNGRYRVVSSPMRQIRADVIAPRPGAPTRTRLRPSGGAAAPR